jgi:signal transduction histidine kinase
MEEEKGHILVVDDNKMNRIKLSRSLEVQGFTVGLAEGGQQALDLLKIESFDVVLLDIVMPGMDGYQVLERIKGDPQLRDIPVIVISALDETESAVRCIEMGAEDYLPKSFDPVLLRARLTASLQKKNLRDLEVAYLEQEMTLRQNEKLATIGRLSAGMAHELNNPTAAAKRGADNLVGTLSRLGNIYFQMFEMGLSEEQRAQLAHLDHLARERAGEPLDMDPLTRSDLEADVEEWLDNIQVEDPWDISPKLVNFGCNPSELDKMAQDFNPEQFQIILQWLDSTCEAYRILASITATTVRIADIVNALKVYTYLDQAPIQNVDINAGLESTIAVLQNKLNGIEIIRSYASDLPEIEAYGSELNQVWTNIIENAIDGVNGRGEIHVLTRQENGWVVVEIADNGTGIPQEIQANIFDPFFTTKPPGQGTGLGLNVSHNIVVQKHKGSIEVHSQPGSTRFEVRLPINLN